LPIKSITDEDFARRAPHNDLTFSSPDFCDYPGGYVDGKFMNKAFLHEVLQHGSEPARAAFMGVKLIFSRDPDIPALLDQIPVYPIQDQRRKLESFYAQMQALQWYMGEAEKRDNRYLATHTAADLVLFGGRMILAHNQILYPYHKWFMQELRRAPDQPAGLLDAIDALLSQPNKTNSDRFCDLVLNFTAWPQPAEGWPARFMQESEQNWRSGQRPPLADC